MKIIRGRARVADAHDSGMSLVEVIVAIAIVSAIALSSASLAINGSSLASSQERKQVAVTIASGAMEAASAQTVSTIYSGRTKTAVQAAFAANSTVPGVAPTYAVWDTTVPVPSAMTLPITAAPITLDGTTYTTTTLLGACYQPRTGGDCTTIAGKSSPPATAPAGYVALVRAVVIVRWSPDKTCAASGCFYSATTLLDPSTDLEWVTHD